MADKTILDFPALTDTEDTDVLYVIRGIGVGRDRHQTKASFLQDILLFGVPVHLLTRSYAENTGMCQDEGMVWASSFVGANVGNKPSTNQDKWNPVMAPTKAETISATGAFTTLYRHHHITSDTLGGDNTITLDDGLFDGQMVYINSDGSAFTYVKGTGLYLGASSTGIKISDGLKCSVKWDASLSKWIADNEITADYVLSSRRFKFTSGGVMEVEQTLSISGGVLNIPLTPPFADTSYNLQLTCESPLARWASYNTKLAGSFDALIWTDTAGHTTEVASFIAVGPY